MKKLLALAVTAPLFLSSATFAQMDEDSSSQTTTAASKPAHPHDDSAKIHKEMCSDHYAHVAGYLAYLQAKLDLTDKQQSAWTKWSQAKLDSAAKEKTTCLAMHPEQDGKETVLDKEDHMEKFLSMKLQSLQSTHSSLQALYDTLSADQKAIFDHMADGHQSMHRHGDDDKE